MTNPQDVKQPDDRGRMPVQSPGSGGTPAEPRRDDQKSDDQGKRSPGDERGQRAPGKEEE